MTTGSWSTGFNGDLYLFGFQSGKWWDGVDGRYTSNAGSRQVQWNPYSMTHRQSRVQLTASSNTVPALPANKYCLCNLKVPGSPLSWARDTAILDASCWGNDPYDFISNFSKFTALWRTQDEYKLLAKLIKKAKGHSFNVGVALAEVDKFSSGVVSTIKQLGFGAADLANGRFESFARRFGTYPPSRRTTRILRTSDISGRFLEMRYAWMPAIQDTFSAAEAFNALSNGPRKQVMRTSGVRGDIPVTYSGYYISRTGRATVRRSYTYEMYEELGALRQMGLGNPASILWERIPYSFVVDWFIPIGTYLELIGQVPYMKGRFLRSSTYEEVWSGEWSRTSNSPTHVVSNVPTFNARHLLLKRETLSSLTVPSPTFQVAGAVQGKRVQNAVALAHQVLIGAGLFLAGKPRLGKDYRVRYGDDGLSRDLLLRLGRI